MKNIETKNIQSHSRNTVLCDGFLIPMTDFVLRIDEFLPQDLGQFFDSWRMSQLRLIENYAKFLKQPLKLEMFVPCDEEGNILEEPKIENYTQEELEHSVMGCDYLDYNKAKEKVLFELNSPVAVETMNYHISRNRNIEYLANFGSIKLTQNSLNTIFGKTVA